MMLMDREFRKGLDECLGRLSRGDDVRSCLEAYPKYADRLEPYLRAASTLRGLGVPRPSAGAQQAARRRLLNAGAGFVFRSGASGPPPALGGGDAVNDVFHALPLPSPIGGDEHGDDEGVELWGRLISVSQFG